MWHTQYIECWYGYNRILGLIPYFWYELVVYGLMDCKLWRSYNSWVWKPLILGAFSICILFSSIDANRGFLNFDNVLFVILEKPCEQAKFDLKNEWDETGRTDWNYPKIQSFWAFLGWISFKSAMIKSQPHIFTIFKNIAWGRTQLFHLEVFVTVLSMSTFEVFYQWKGKIEPY